jgi:hypothetical protein
MMVDGIHVAPVEWWDPKWVADHVIEKLHSFEHPVSAAAPTPGTSAEPAPTEGTGRRGRRHR